MTKQYIVLGTKHLWGGPLNAPRPRPEVVDPDLLFDNIDEAHAAIKILNRKPYTPGKGEVGRPVYKAYPVPGRVGSAAMKRAGL